MNVRAKVPTGEWDFDLKLSTGTRWAHPNGLRVVSSVDDIKGEGPTWHVSASRADGPISDEDMSRVRADFDMHDAEEDNRFSHRARHLWLLVAKAKAS